MQLPYKEYIVYCSINYVLYYDVHNQALDPIYMVHIRKEYYIHKFSSDIVKNPL